MTVENGCVIGTYWSLFQWHSKQYSIWHHPMMAQVYVKASVDILDSDKKKNSAFHSWIWNNRGGSPNRNLMAAHPTRKAVLLTATSPSAFDLMYRFLGLVLPLPFNGLVLENTILFCLDYLTFSDDYFSYFLFMTLWRKLYYRCSSFLS